MVNLVPFFTLSFGAQYERVWVLETEHDSWLEIENGLHSIAFSFVSCNCFLDHYWEGAGHLMAIFPLSLVTTPEVFAKLNSAQSSRILKWSIEI